MMAPFLLRIVAGLVFIDLGILAFKNEKQRWITSLFAIRIPRPEIAVKALGSIEIICGIMLVAGLYTQVAALILALLVFAEVYVEYKAPEILKRTLVFYVMLLSIVLSLLLSGAGAFAVDLPL